MKPKEWLLANGHIKEITRGRMSREHINLIEQAVRDGVSIEGYAVSTVQPKSEDEKALPKVEKRAVSSDRLIDVPDEARSESDWEAHTASGPVGMRTVCNTCHSSLTYCHCQHPRVWVDHETEGVVFFKPRKTPLSNKRW